MGVIFFEMNGGVFVLLCRNVINGLSSWCCVDGWWCSMKCYDVLCERFGISGIRCLLCSLGLISGMCLSVMFVLFMVVLIIWLKLL